jgi:hypothetical protein
MRKRYQKGTVKLVKGKWIAQWRENGQKRKRTLGRGPKMTKSEAGTKLAEIVAPINARGQDPTPDMAFGMFVTTMYLPFYGRKWKRSTTMSNHDRLERYLVSEFGARKLGGFRVMSFRIFSTGGKRTGCRIARWRTYGGTCGRFSGWRWPRALSNGTRLTCYLCRVVARVQIPVT